MLGNHSPITKLLKKTPLYARLVTYKHLTNLGKHIHKKQEQKILLIQAQVLNYIDYSYFKRLSDEYNYRLCLWIFDSVHASSPTFLSVFPTILDTKWDGIYTYDKFDAQEFGWRYICNQAYFSTKKYPKPCNSKPTKYDIYFAGGLKGNKEKLLFPLDEFFKTNGIKALFSLYCYNDEQLSAYSTQYKDIYFYRKWKSYKKILEETINSKCILEILQEGQTAQSLRYFEAIYFNKKLLTNNPDIVNLPYYNPQYMRYFQDISDIDINWLKEDIEVDYGYNNDFTPLRFIEQARLDFTD